MCIYIYIYTHIHTYTYIHIIHVCTYIYIYIYVYKEREREREIHTHTHYTYIYIYTQTHIYISHIHLREVGGMLVEASSRLFGSRETVKGLNLLAHACNTEENGFIECEMSNSTIVVRTFGAPLFRAPLIISSYVHIEPCLYKWLNLGYIS